jgi:hypothetical protein
LQGRTIANQISMFQSDVWVFGRLAGLIILQILTGRDNISPSTWTFKMTTCDNLHLDFKNGTIANKVGLVNCLLQPGQISNACESL